MPAGDRPSKNPATFEQIAREQHLTAADLTNPAIRELVNRVVLQIDHNVGLQQLLHAKDLGYTKYSWSSVYSDLTRPDTPMSRILQFYVRRGNNPAQLRLAEKALKIEHVGRTGRALYTHGLLVCVEIGRGEGEKRSGKRLVFRPYALNYRGEHDLRDCLTKRYARELESYQRVIDVYSRLLTATNPKAIAQLEDKSA